MSQHDITYTDLLTRFFVRSLPLTTVLQDTPLYDARALVLFLFLALCFVIPFFLRKNLVDKDGHSIPPGPLLRYAFLRRYPERALRVWTRTYGPLFSVWMGNQLFVVVSDARIAGDLFVSNGAILSSRKQYFIKNNTILRGRAITATPYNNTWSVVINESDVTRSSCSLGRRQHRRIAMQLLTPKAIQGYASVLEYEAHILVQSLYHKSKMGTLPINPAYFTGRYALKWVAIFFSVVICKSDVY